MKLPYITVAILVTSLLVGGILADEKIIRKRTRRSNRVARQTSADQMVQNILKWLQGVYTQQSRRSRFADYHNPFNFASGKLDDAFRQGTLREYLPPTNTQKPRPFETARPPGGDGTDQNGNYIYGGYPPAGSITPQPPFPIFTRPPPGGVPGEGYPSTIGYPQTTFPGQGTPPRPTGYPSDTAGTTGPEGYPTPGFPTHAPEGPTPGGQTVPGGFTGYPGVQTTPGGFTGYPGGETTPGFTGYPGAQTTPGFPGAPGGHTTPGGFTGAPGGETTPGGFTGAPGGQTPPGGFTGAPGGQTAPGGFTGYPGSQTTPGGFTGPPDSQTTPGGFTGAPGGETTPGGFTGAPGGQTPPGGFTGAPGEQTAPGGFTGYPGSQTTPGGFTGPPDSQTTPGGFTGYPAAQTTPGVPTEAPTQPPTTTSAPAEKPGFPTQPPPGLTGYPEGPGPSTQPPPELTSVLPGFPTQPPPGAFTGYPTREPEVTEGTPQPDLTRIPTPAPEATESPSGKPEGTEAPPQQPEATEAPSEKPEITEAPAQPEDTEAPATSGRPVGPTEPSVVETESPTSKPSTSPPVTEIFTSATSPEEQPPAGEATTQSPEINTIPTGRPGKPGEPEPQETDNEDLKHPPHIHAIDVECAKDMMTINLEFNREFNGIIYSKGYYNMPECRYVKENSGQTKYTFTVNLNQCGTEFINAFDTQGQSYLENVLVLQNEAGVQEIWDTVRAVRCLWEGNLKETLSVALSVGMLSQELVTFSGDTAVAKLDILLGRGPLGQPANGLVKIGESMTLVVSVSGDPGFDLQVKDCRATDSTGDNTIPLTDDNGCVLKPKLFGAFQKTRSTGDTGASIIAYAYFNAFKFPDVMDLMIECNIELCKTDCDMCTDPNQKVEPGRRRRRDLYSYNETLHDGVTMGKHLRIILPEDLSVNDRTVLDLGRNDGVCMSTQSFVFSTALLISLLTASCLFSAYMWLKTQQLKLIKK